MAGGGGAAGGVHGTPTAGAAAANARKKLVSVSNKARGREPQKYEFEVIPFFVRARARGPPAAAAGRRRATAARVSRVRSAADCLPLPPPHRPAPRPPRAGRRPRAPLRRTLVARAPPAGELPAGVDKAVFVWERGAKLQATKAEDVNPHTHAVFWRQYLKLARGAPPPARAAPRRATPSVSQCAPLATVSAAHPLTPPLSPLRPLQTQKKTWLSRWPRCTSTPAACCPRNITSRWPR